MKPNLGSTSQLATLDLARAVERFALVAEASATTKNIGRKDVGRWPDVRPYPIGCP